jgi:hypothetical protein
MGFIDDMRAAGHAVESTCRVQLGEQGCPVAARAWRRSRRPADRTVSDAVIMNAILATAGTTGRRGWLTVFQKRIEPTAHTRDAGSGRCPQVNPVQPPSFPCLAIVP